MISLPDGVLLRLATPDDAAAAARMHRECWREAYATMADADLLAARLSNAETWEGTWREQVEHGPPRVLAVHGGEPIGFAVAGPARDPGPVDTELLALYVRRAWWGTGVGQALLDEVVGDRSCTLWVLEANLRARAFYARNGFAADGSRELMEWLDTWEIRLVR